MELTWGPVGAASFGFCGACLPFLRLSSYSMILSMQCQQLSNGSQLQRFKKVIAQGDENVRDVLWVVVADPLDLVVHLSVLGLLAEHLLRDEVLVAHFRLIALNSSVVIKAEE